MNRLVVDSGRAASRAMPIPGVPLSIADRRYRYKTVNYDNVFNLEGAVLCVVVLCESKLVYGATIA